MRERKDRGRPLDAARGRPAAAAASSPRLLPLVLLLFVGSGAAALIYEVVWFQLIQLVIGATAVSLGVLLATFMGGLCAGSLLAPRLIPAHRHPLRVYAYLELGIAACGVLILVALPALSYVYVPSIGQGFIGLLLRGLLCGVFLLPPTMLMGATLPAVARWVDSTPGGVSWLGFFYGGNIAGAVIGSLVSGFYLLRVFDMPTATYVAVATNVGVATLALVMAGRMAHDRRAEKPKDHVLLAGTSRATYVVVALSGFAALGAEVAWTRILTLLLGGTVYTFSMIAGGFLSGLGIGSAAGTWAARQTRRPGVALAVCQMGVMLGVAWAATLMSRAFPYWPIDPALATGPWFNFQIDLLRVVISVLPAALFWGASFPIALAAIAPRTPDAGRLVAGLYAANTIGAVAGALVVSLAVIPAFGTLAAQRLLIWTAGIAAVLMFISTSTADVPLASVRRAGLAVAALVLAVSAAASVAPVPTDLIAYGRQIATFRGARYLYQGEGLNASVAVSELEGGVRNFHVSGKVEASTEVHDMRLQRLLGHVSALMHPRPRTVLVVGFGAGVTAGSFVLHPSVERIVICEIEPLIPRVVAGFFSKENNDVLSDPRVEVVYDDARHYILTTDEKFDVITSDPIHPWVKGAAALYTKEYFEQVRAHLNPGGVVTQWVPLYQSSEDVVKSEIATFFDVFPNGTIWSNQYASGGGYDVVMLARPEPLRIDPAALQERLERPDHARVVAALDEVEIPGVPGLLATYAGQATDLRPWLANAQINTDRNLRLEYLAGMANNVYDARIYENMLAHRRFPEEMFIGPAEWKDALRRLPPPGVAQPGGESEFVATPRTKTHVDIR
jgi:spermidine synthase